MSTVCLQPPPFNALAPPCSPPSAQPAPHHRPCCTLRPFVKLQASGTAATHRAPSSQTHILQGVADVVYVLIHTDCGGASAVAASGTAGSTPPGSLVSSLCYPSVIPALCDLAFQSTRKTPRALCRMENGSKIALLLLTVGLVVAAQLIVLASRDIGKVGSNLQNKCQCFVAAASACTPLFNVPCTADTQRPCRWRRGQRRRQQQRRRRRRSCSGRQQQRRRRSCCGRRQGGPAVPYQRRPASRAGVAAVPGVCKRGSKEEGRQLAAAVLSNHSHAAGADPARPELAGRA